MGSTRGWLAAALGAVTVACGAAPLPGMPRMQPVDYVALGDSAASAPFVPDPVPSAGCLRSTNNYPSVLARRINPVSFTDVTCSGATTKDITSQSQPTYAGPVPPQIDAVSGDTDLITITLGGNDIELVEAAMQCRTSSLDSPPCAEQFVVDGVDRFSAAITGQVPAWAAMLDALHAKAPQVRIILVGYGTYIRPGGCFPDQPAHPVDADYFQAKVDEIDNAQRTLAADKGVDYFDTRPLTMGHDMCAAPDDRYIEGFEPTHKAAALHPNAMGAAAVGNALADYVAG